MGGTSPDIERLDRDAVVEAVLDAAEGPVFSIVEFDSDSFDPLFVADETEGFYRDEDHMLEHFSEIHNYVNLDFMEIDLFTKDLLPVADRVRYKVTAVDAMMLARIYFGEEGLFMAMGPSVPMEPIVSAVEDIAGIGD